MIEMLIYVCAIFGLAFLLKESDGPWGLVAKGRNLLIGHKKVGKFFYDLLDCYFCLGFHCGWIVYLLSAEPFHLQFIILWGLAGGTISLTLSKLLNDGPPTV